MGAGQTVCGKMNSTTATCRPLLRTGSAGASCDAVTVDAARLLGLDGYGLEPGCKADFVVLQARDPIEAIRQRAARLYVVRRGKVIAESPAQTGRLHFPGRPDHTSFTA